MGKNNLTDDEEHIQFGDVDSLNNIPGLDVPLDQGGFESNYSGRIMSNPSGGGFGSAFIEPDED